MNIYLRDPQTEQGQKVDSKGRGLVASTSFTRYEQASADGNAFNVNTEYIRSITSAGDNGILYLKNTSDNEVAIEAWFWGVENLSGGTPTGNPILKAFYNPTGGTLISDANPVNLVNRNAGSSETFGDIVAYKASGTGKTVTGTTDPVLYQLQGSGRTFGTIFLTLPKNSSVAITIDIAGYATADVYAGFTGFYNI